MQERPQCAISPNPASIAHVGDLDVAPAVRTVLLGLCLRRHARMPSARQNQFATATTAATVTTAVTARKEVTP